MPHHFHAVVWIDHREAHVFEFSRDEAERRVVRHHHAPHSIHHKANSMGAGHAGEDWEYLAAVAEALKPAGEILIVGPSHVKTELKTYLAARVPDVAAKVVGIETLNHPSDGEIIAFARKYFERADRTTPQRP